MTTRSALVASLITAVCCSWIPLAAQPQPAKAKSLYERYTEPIPIFKTGLGTFTRPMSSKDPEAQKYFDQGFQMMYSFAKPEAVRSFREAWKKDPTARSAIGARRGRGART